MANKEDNLIPTNKMSPEQLKEFTSKGGKASAVVRRKRADFIKVAKALMDCELSKHDRELVEARFKELAPEEINYRTLILIKQLEKALKGDINAAKYVQDATGEKPKDNIEVETKLPITYIEVTNNKDLKKKFESYEDNTETK